MSLRCALRLAALAVLCVLSEACGPLAPAPSTASASSPATVPSPVSARWAFVVGGDSRDCGDVVMPAVAEGTRAANAVLYWHLGDFRSLRDFDQDYLHQPERRGKRSQFAEYQRLAWDDFIQWQLAPFGSTPVLLAIGNHEVYAPKTRLEYVSAFADWIATPEIRDQRLKDDPRDHRVRTWYHLVKGGVDFITLDNAAHDSFDAEQVAWFEGVVARAEKDPGVRAIAVGMHAALPDSLASDHSMGSWAQGIESGRSVYARLVEARRAKPVYVFASHSHFYMSGIFATEAHRKAGTVLPGWIVGTTGAIRYALPTDASQAAAAKTNVYGYLVVTVGPDAAEPFAVEFREIDEKDIPAATVERFGADFIHRCFEGNSLASASPPP